MKCYHHNESDAVGTCKSCGKGLCPECAADVGNGIACKNRCEEEVVALNELVERSKASYGKVRGAYARNALIYALFGGFFVLFGLGISSRETIFGIAIITMGILMLVGAMLTYQSGKKFDQK